MKPTIHAVVLAGALATAGTASADPLGVPGQIAVAGDFELELSSTSIQDSELDSITRVAVLPALDFFLAPNLSVGGQLGVDYISGGDDEQTTVVAAARVGYVIGLGKVSIWPRAGLSFERTSLDAEVGEDPNITRLTFNLFAPLLFHPADHFFIGLGPVLDYDLVADSNVELFEPAKFTTIGLRSTVGGYF